MHIKHGWVYLAVNDIEVFIAKVLEDLVDVLLFIEQGECLQQVASATHDSDYDSAVARAAICTLNAFHS